MAGTLHVRSLEFKLGGADGGFWEREALLAAQAQALLPPAPQVQRVLGLSGCLAGLILGGFDAALPLALPPVAFLGGRAATTLFWHLPTG